ncbi:MAG: dTMP kinase [Candidatus Thorarchaeota archaeon]
MASESPRRSGFLFVIEGIDGAGKTVVCDRLTVLLAGEGMDVVRLREPTNESPWGKEIRERTPRGELTPNEELELYMRDREWHIQNRIEPALAASKVVLMDRYFFAAGAYQSTSTGLHWSEILRRNREEIRAPEPDIVFLLDVPAEVGLARIATARQGSLNIQFEKHDRLVMVRQAYLEMVAEDSANFLVIDATIELKGVVAEVFARIADFVRKHGLPSAST